MKLSTKPVAVDSICFDTLSRDCALFVKNSTYNNVHDFIELASHVKRKREVQSDNSLHDALASFPARQVSRDYFARYSHGHCLALAEGARDFLAADPVHFPEVDAILARSYPREDYEHGAVMLRSGDSMRIFDPVMGARAIMLDPQHPAIRPSGFPMRAQVKKRPGGETEVRAIADIVNTKWPQFIYSLTPKSLAPAYQKALFVERELTIVKDTCNSAGVTRLTLDFKKNRVNYESGRKECDSWSFADVSSGNGWIGDRQLFDFVANYSEEKLTTQMLRKDIESAVNDSALFEELYNAFHVEPKITLKQRLRKALGEVGVYVYLAKDLIRVITAKEEETVSLSR